LEEFGGKERAFGAQELGWKGVKGFNLWAGPEVIKQKGRVSKNGAQGEVFGGARAKPGKEKSGKARLKKGAQESPGLLAHARALGDLLLGFPGEKGERG